MAHYRTYTFATSTARTYKTQLKAYTAFCNLLHIPPLPISQLNLARYIAYLSSRLCYTSVKQYLNIVRLLHIESGVANPLGTWYLDSLLRGCRRVMGNTSKPKLPITVELLKKMFSFLNLTLHVDLTFWAVCLVGFFSFLRKSNLLSNSSKAQGVSMLTRGMYLSFLQVYYYVFRTAKQYNLGSGTLKYLYHISLIALFARLVPYYLCVRLSRLTHVPHSLLVHHKQGQG